MWVLELLSQLCSLLQHGGLLPSQKPGSGLGVVGAAILLIWELLLPRAEAGLSPVLWSQSRNWGHALKDLPFVEIAVAF